MLELCEKPENGQKKTRFPLKESELVSWATVKRAYRSRIFRQYRIVRFVVIPPEASYWGSWPAYTYTCIQTYAFAWAYSRRGEPTGSSCAQRAHRRRNDPPYAGSRTWVRERVWFGLYCAGRYRTSARAQARRKYTARNVAMQIFFCTGGAFVPRFNRFLTDWEVKKFVFAKIGKKDASMCSISYVYRAGGAFGAVRRNRGRFALACRAGAPARRASCPGQHP